MKLCNQIQKKIGPKWQLFANSVQEEAQQEVIKHKYEQADGISVNFDFFIELLKNKFNVLLSDDQ